MRKGKHIWGIALAALFLITLSAVGTFGASQISRVRVYVSDDKLTQDDDFPEITLPSNVDYDISEIEAVTKRESWKPGSTVRIAVYLEAADGYVFTASEKSQFSISGGDYVSSSITDEGQGLKLVFRFGPIRSVLGVPENPRWSDNVLGRAVWKRVPNAKSYNVYLVRDGDESGAVRYTADTNQLDFLDKLKASSNYYFRVQAVPRDSDERKYMQAGELADSTILYGSTLGETGGAWQNEGTGWRYLSTSGESYANTWKLIDGVWYYFDQSGYRNVGWCVVDGKRYYCNDKGQMQRDWIQLDNIWYHLKNSGEASIGWFQTVPGIWFYTDMEGRMLTGWQTVDGKWYYLNPSGELALDTTIDGYYVNGSGEWIP